MAEADWVLTDSKMNVALGAEIQKARNAAGLTRPQLVARLPFRLTTATIANWERGDRAITYRNLVELARALGHTAPQLLERAIDQAESIQTEYVHLDVIALRDNATVRGLLRGWAARKSETLDEGERVALIHHAVIREWAFMLNVSLIELILHLEEVASLAPRTAPDQGQE